MNKAQGSSAAVSNSSGPPSSALKKISIIIACRNEARHIRAFVQSILAQDLAGFDWELIIADGASHDGTREQLAEIVRGNPRVVVIDNPNCIVSTGLNAAIAAARGDTILRADAHTEYAPDYVKRCVEALETTGAANVGGPARTKAEGILPCAIQAAYHSRFSTGGARFHDDSYSGYVDTVPYGCWRKQTLVQLGLFDEGLVRNQDDELNLRLIRSGGKIWQSADIVSWYWPRSSWSSLFRQYFQYGFWKVRVIRKHRLPGSWRHLAPGAFIALNFLLLCAAILSLALGRKSIAHDSFLALVALLGAYALALLVASLDAARKNGWQLFPYLPFTFAVFHVSYGLGFILGSIYWTFSRSRPQGLSNLFVGVTR